MLVKYGVNSGFTTLGSAKDYILSSSAAVLRRQQFLIRSLGGGYTDQTTQRRMQQVNSMSGTALEAESDSILRAISPTLDPNRHKGQAGKIAVIGGCHVSTLVLHILLLFQP
ncbi:hypothetical protein Ddye_006563 [Dipteronia dyeriana]|uniref:YjeF C-terminal domain-containing protein n=1 Tax=Dipteronia dyeriana TaxID=168575 RepID=A0AAD9XIB3_9ROSI|nr:hypothetical protein Ddye_006563 [Dipteronia dyeriana]